MLSQLIFSGQRGVLSQKIKFFITTALRTSNPTQFSILFLIPLPKLTKFWLLYRISSSGPPKMSCLNLISYTAILFYHSS
jgi:hypothetical protein